jgi:uncharacterized caspase-like protein
MSNYAVVIGINDYTPPEQQGLKALHGAIPDAKEFYNWVTTRGGVPSANCHLILSTFDPQNPKPVKKEVDDALVKIIKAVVANDNKDADRFYYYFAGHGLAVELDKYNNGMCMADWSEWNRDAAALSSRDYEQKFLNEGLFKEVVIFLDCCRNPKLFFHPQGAPAIVRLGPNNNTKYLVGFGAQSQNEAFENLKAPEPRGIFTKVLLDGLNGAAAKEGNKIPAANLVDYVTIQVPLEAQEVGFIQEPEFSSNTSTTKTIYFDVN